MPGFASLKNFFVRPGVMAASEDQPRADELVRVSSRSLIALRQQAESLPLKAIKILSPQSGAYLSPFKGRGMDFEESRMYQAGDDIRNIDWRVTARTGDAHTKVFREERERAVLMWVDLRQPMFFATRGAFKAVQAAKAAALLAWSAIQHGDRLGGLIFSEQRHDELRPQRGDRAVLHFIKQLSHHPAWTAAKKYTAQNGTALQSLIRLRRVAKPGSLVILLSDFQNLGQQAESHLTHLARHNDVMLVFFYDPLESQLPRNGLYPISDGENTLVLNTSDTAVCESHQKKFRQHRDYVQNLCRRHGMYFLDCATTDSPQQRLADGLRLKRK